VNGRPGPILLVDDNVDERDLLVRAFARIGVTNPIVVATDGKEALDLVHGATDPLTPALVLLDLNMPRLDGSVVVERMRADARTRLVPVVVLTSSALETDVAACYRAGANRVVQKPVDYTEFVDVVRDLCRDWLVVSEPAR
jgi:two-component system response regulator